MSHGQVASNSCLLNNLPLEERRGMFETILDELGKRFGTRDPEQILAEAYRMYHGSYPPEGWFEKERGKLAEYQLPYSATWVHLRLFGDLIGAERSMLRRQ